MVASPMTHEGPHAMGDLVWHVTQNEFCLVVSSGYIASVEQAMSWEYDVFSPSRGLMKRERDWHFTPMGCHV